MPGVEIDRLAKATIEQQVFERHRANEDRRNGQRDERPGHGPQFLERRATPVAATMIVMRMVMSVVAMCMIVMRTVPFFGVRLVFLGVTVRLVRHRCIPTRLA